VVQSRLIGTGSYLKLEIQGSIQRSVDNPFGKVSIDLFRIWGRESSLNFTKIKENESKSRTDRARINRILLELGVDFSYESGKEIFYSKKFWRPIDLDSRDCFEGLIQRKAELMKREDFSALKALRTMAEEVLRIGGEIYLLQAELEKFLLTEKFDKAEQLKNEIRALIKRRDNIDVLFETSRFDRMVIFDRETSEEYKKRIDKQDNVMLRQLEEERLRKLAIMDERIKIGKENYRDQETKPISQIQEKPVEDSIVVVEEKPKPIPIKKKPFLIKKSGLNMKKVAKENSEMKNSKKLNGKNENDYFEKNQGDIELESYFRPLSEALGNKISKNIEEGSYEFLSRMSSLGLLNVFGVGVWAAICHSNWRMREASITAVMNYLKGSHNKRLAEKTKKLFLSCCELAKAVCDDKIPLIYISGLQLLRCALEEKICGADVDSPTYNRAISEFVPILIQKISEINKKTQTLSLHTLISIFKHPKANIDILFSGITDICPKEREAVLYNIQKQPIDKLPVIVVMARLQILKHAIKEFGNRFDFVSPVKLLALPALLHGEIAIRDFAMICFKKLYKIDPLATREIILESDKVNDRLNEGLDKRFQEVDEKKKSRKQPNRLSGLGQVREEEEIHEDVGSDIQTEDVANE
jgi:centrosomal protein CEP104